MEKANDIKISSFKKRDKTGSDNSLSNEIELIIDNIGTYEFEVIDNHIFPSLSITNNDKKNKVKIVFESAIMHRKQSVLENFSNRKIHIPQLEEKEPFEIELNEKSKKSLFFDDYFTLNVFLSDQTIKPSKYPGEHILIIFELELNRYLEEYNKDNLGAAIRYYGYYK